MFDTVKISKLDDGHFLIEVETEHQDYRLSGRNFNDAIKKLKKKLLEIEKELSEMANEETD